MIKTNGLNEEAWRRIKNTIIERSPEVYDALMASKAKLRVSLNPDYEKIPKHNQEHRFSYWEILMYKGRSKPLGLIIAQAFQNLKLKLNLN